MSEKKDRIRIGISQGDTNGVGYEVIIKALNDHRILDLCLPIVYGSKKISTAHKKEINLETFAFNFIDNIDEAKGKKVNLISCCDEETPVEFGVATESSGKAAFDSLNAAVNDLVAGKIDALVTAPINKKNIQSDVFSFPGHTEFLAQKSGGKKGLMFMISEKLKVGVVTGHIPLKDVASAISSDQIMEKLKVMNKSLQQDFNIRKPKIAVLGLNPHSGDNGLLGTEEVDLINGTIAKAREQKILAYGPFPADGFFGSTQYMQYDAVLAMYHDQGLVPFKALSFGEGVNFTAGLDFIRTSPDHGTGYDLAGKNEADESSFRQALYAAIDIFKSRSLNLDLESGALKPSDNQERRGGKGRSDDRNTNRKPAQEVETTEENL